MLQISKAVLKYSDENYRHAVNYSQPLYNYPVTLNFGDKHNRTKYILPVGSSDNIELWQEGIFIYVLAQNNGLEYISLQVINAELKEVEQDVYFNESDLNDSDFSSYGLLDKCSEDQIKIMLQYAG